MKACLLFGLLVMTASAHAQSENVDFFIMGGALRALNENTWTAESGFIYKPTNHFGIGFAYNNDGHLRNNHRDGMLAQAWYIRALGDGFELQVGTGPYANMNNTSVDGVRINEFKVGLMSSVALKWRLPGNTWYLRTQYNNTWVPGSFNSNALLFGVGRDFAYSDEPTSGRFLNADVSAWGGASRTTQLGDQHTAAAWQIEAQYLVENPQHWWDIAAYSVAYLSEGDTNLSHRTGVPFQLWWIGQTRHVTFSFGIGPYVAYDGDRGKKLIFAGIGSIRVMYLLKETQRHRYEAGLMYTRVASFYNRDQDIFMIGLLARL